MKRLMPLLTVLMVVGLSAAAAAAGEDPAAPFIQKAKGDVAVKPADVKSWSPASIGADLSGGDAVKTGSDGRAEVWHPGGAIRLFPNSHLLVPAVKDTGGIKAINKVALDKGTGVFRVSPRSVKGGFEVQTLQVIAGVKGTMFSVYSSQNMSRVAVYRGVVEVTDLKRTPATSTLLYRGQYIEVVDGRGFGVKKGFYPGDPWSDWSRGKPEPSLDDPGDVRNSQGASSMSSYSAS